MSDVQQQQQKKKKKRVQFQFQFQFQFLVSLSAIIALTIAAERCRQLIGEESSSKSGKFTLLNCFDMGSGSLACIGKEGVKLYVYNLRSAHVERHRHQAIERSIGESLAQGVKGEEAAKQAQKIGAKAAKQASRQAKRITGPIIASGWDFFEAIYYGGTVTEGFLRGTGTLFGTYVGGYHGEERLGRFGYLIGSHFGSWVGGRLGLMVYDVVSGVKFLLQFVNPEDIITTSTEIESSSSSYEKSNFGDENEKLHQTFSGSDEL